MEQPNTRNVIKDAERKVTYVVMAYRQLSREEIVIAVRHHLSQRRGQPKKGSTIIIMTTFGYND